MNSILESGSNEALLDSWRTLIRCPWCGEGSFQNSDDRLFRCASCDRAFRSSRNQLTWDGVAGIPSIAKGGRGFDVLRACKRAFNLLRKAINPLSTPVMPFRYWSAHRTTGYYRRTLHDRAFAEKWAGHYLSGLRFSPNPSVLDHGCGRGRHLGLLAQLGFRVSGQDVSANEWWKNFPEATLQVVPAECDLLPWANDSFDLVLDVGVLGLIPAASHDLIMMEMKRVLKKGGYWIILEANEGSYGRKHFQQGLLSLSLVRALAEKTGFKEVDISYEGFYAPVFPQLVNFIRKQCGPWPMDIADYDSSLARMSPPEKRGLWRLRLQRGDN